MGGLLRAPKLPTVAVPAQPVATPAPVVAATDAPDDTDAQRRRRGLAGTIATSDRGLADDGRVVPSRKTLLGE